MNGPVNAEENQVKKKSSSVAMHNDWSASNVSMNILQEREMMAEVSGSIETGD